MEISTHFTCARWFLFEHKYQSGSLLQNVNSVLLFLTFLGGRVAFQAYVVSVVGVPWLIETLTDSQVSGLYKAYAFFASLSIAINFALNLYWLSLII